MRTHVLEKSFLQSLGYGNHLGQFYATLKQSLELLPYFFKCPKQKNLFVWILPKNLSKSSAERFISILFPHRYSPTEMNPLVFSQEEFFFEAGRFNLPKALGNWDELAKIASAQQKEGIRCVTCTDAIKNEDLSLFNRYESILAKRTQDISLVALFQYPLRQYTHFEFALILQKHRSWLFHSSNQWMRVENLEIDQKDRQLKHAHHELTSIRRLKQSHAEFLCRLTHDFKTPLTIILSAIQYLDHKKNPILDPITLKYLNIMRQNCNHILELANNMIDSNKHELGLLKPHFVESDIVATVEKICNHFVHHVKMHNLSLSFIKNISTKKLCYDPHQIERILLNLLSNAVKFSKPNGHIFVKISTFKKPPSPRVIHLHHTNTTDEVILISVKDNGTGMNTNVLKSLFHFNDHAKNLTPHPNTTIGIGLSLVKSMVDSHHGSIHVRSKLGVGSEFLIQIPVQKKSVVASYLHYPVAL